MSRSAPSSPPALTIRIKKNADGSAALTLRRADGSVTWQRQNEKLGRFFPLHDLTHLAVETAFGFTNAFYGLVSRGWDFADFATRGPRGRVPAEAIAAEMIVGVFDLERNLGLELSCEEMNEQLRNFCEVDGSEPPAPLTEDRIRSVREMRSTLFARWNALPAGEAMEVSFTPPATVPE